MLKSYSIPMAKRYAQPHSIPTVVEASHAFLLTCGVFRQFEPSLGTATKAILHRQSRVTRQVSWVFEQVKQSTSLSVIREIVARELSCIPPIYHYQMSSATCCIPPITTRWPVQPAASLLSLPVQLVPS